MPRTIAQEMARIDAEEGAAIARDRWFCVFLALSTSAVLITVIVATRLL